MRTSNPALNASVFQIRDLSSSATMTLPGTVMKAAILLSLVIVGAGFTWYQMWAGMMAAAPAEAGAVGAAGLSQVPQTVYYYMIGGAIVGLVLAMITIFKPAISPYTTPIYALAEGVFLGGTSAMFNYMYPGIVFQAVTLTFGTLAVLLAAYSTRVIRASENFKLGVVAATGGIFVFYMLSMILGFFGVQIPGVFGNGLVGIAFSAFVVVVAALNLVLDFDFIEKGCDQGAPKYMEWYGAFGLLVTLVWLYLEILRLLVKLRSRD